MIRLTRLNHAPIVVNSDLIEHIDSTPDTVITLTNGQVLGGVVGTRSARGNCVVRRTAGHSLFTLV